MFDLGGSFPVESDSPTPDLLLKLTFPCTGYRFRCHATDSHVVGFEFGLGGSFPIESDSPIPDTLFRLHVRAPATDLASKTFLAVALRLTPGGLANVADGVRIDLNYNMRSKDAEDFKFQHRPPFR